MLQPRAKVSGFPLDLNNRLTGDDIREQLRKKEISACGAMEYAKHFLLSGRIRDARSIIRTILNMGIDHCDSSEERITCNNFEMSQWEYRTALASGHHVQGENLLAIHEYDRRKKGVTDAPIDPLAFMG